MAGMQGFGSAWHLAGRFFGSLAPFGPSRSDEQWALTQLTEAEQALFGRMSPPDRRHAIRVANDALRLSERRLGGGSAPPAGFVPAALLHDVGKVESHLGTFSRVLATLLALVLGRGRSLAWQDGPGRYRRRVGAYLAHDRIGAALLEGSGSDSLAVAWAREHHLPAARWTIDPVVASCLKDADGD
jgi:hypothetical protein